MSKYRKKFQKPPEPAPAVPVAKPKPFASFLRTVRLLFWGLVGLFLAFHVMVVALLYIWQTKPITNSMFMIVHRASTLSGVKQTWVEYDQIAKSAKQAVIASEDASFVKHSGFDWQGIADAIKRNQQTGDISAGGSTISQQLAKNLFLISKRSYIRKAEEALITVIIERMWTKERILTAYLNVVEFGHGIYGIEQASRHYFNKSAKDLSKRESALLISMLPNPKYYEKNLDNERLQNKKAIILKRMNGATLP